MSKPLLQIALDSLSLETAVADAKQAESVVDIIECGTILACAEGMKAVKTLRALHPNHIIVCDLKTTDGGAILAKMAFEAGADWLTVSAAAHSATKAACKKVADEFNAAHPELKVKKEIQIEIYGNWTVEKDVQEWLDLGVTQAIYHRSRDAELAGKSWTAEDIELMQQLSQKGLALSITGGIVPEDIHLFKTVKNAKAFISGRALVGEKGKQTAKAIRAEIDKYWQ
ncbi:3-keto-L-gulonate-6-phosphate decarboxylase [[Haemophilus] ducreyi]|uniref:Hexulose-6-phosphate synthase n=2 Tax=Haemophilus ducreyi TaxID=730 RepID=Q7VKM6_HAEDU|nr:3-keto-L-gulonate-6-phosphate decarboxylase UlaD [[Haemophilus] ducreyi]AAP96597.1 putative hexulose-6-phosphate synthase [[Haemophilus] ducreyi 35000HP]AKO31441.1 3-keto-L-gulonate-6-phosphate decarboxylase [[Haemophilus] ducreyi]AKO32895.1 3-keto-L-gulonate-6-phosphate decarboxylase [[Haemophilus] ducreyi]AKO34342.1 3-keto-L-gulonate-6-phosphate decarboxylase [[Haemophilus] ducreyi]AKO35786.1 3-keto-L-gulonate-6-phosphate decarboxylase [[Haemophilus] ducreyi]